MQNVPTRPTPPLEPADVFTLLGTEGRLGRLQYFYITAISQIAAALLYTLCDTVGENPAALGASALPVAIVAIFFILVSSVVIFLSTVKRMHDLNLAGGWALFCLVPFVCLVLYFIPGTKGLNRFGAPRSNKHLYWNAPVVTLAPALLLFGAVLAAELALPTLAPQRYASATPPAQTELAVAEPTATPTPTPSPSPTPQPTPSPAPTPTPTLTAAATLPPYPYTDSAIGFSLSLLNGWNNEPDEDGSANAREFVSKDNLSYLTVVVEPSTDTNYDKVTKKELQRYADSLGKSDLEKCLGNDIVVQGDVKGTVETIDKKKFMALRADATWNGATYRYDYFCGIYGGKAYLIVIGVPADAPKSDLSEAEAIVKTFHILPAKK